jgi:cell division protein FtsI/penicillin-binding protein 2
MARATKRLARNLALAVGLGVAAAVLAGSSGGGGAPAQVSGGTRLDEPDRTRVAEAASGARRETGKAKAKAKPKKLVGDADLAGKLDLSKMELVDDHYEVPLGDGRRAVLTLDPKLQAAAEKVLARAKAPRGAVVITGVDGRILAYAGRRTEDKKGGKNGVLDHSLANTVWAPAASIFKIATAAALVEAGVGPHDKVCYHGGLRSVMESNLEDSKRDNRCNDLAYGLAHSQNAIIAKLVHKHLQPETLRATAASLGFAGDLPSWALGGQAGTVDVPAEKGVDFGKTAAGFRGSDLSPLAGALLANTIATGGLEATPTIVASIKDGDKTIPVELPAAQRVLAEKAADAVGEMMVQTCDSGSGAKAFRGKDGLARSIKVAGKTGTLSRKPAPDWEFELEYSWFVGYAPADKPRFSVAVVLGNTDLWWLKSHTAARMLLREALAEP